MKTFIEHEDFFQTKDGQKLFYSITKPGRSKGVLIIVHGLGEHSGRYQEITEFFAKAGWTIYRYDQRGHGQTPGPRGYAESLEILVEDLHQFLNFVKQQQKSKKFFLLGHSFGGQVAINFLAEYPKLVDGAILSSPNIALTMKVPWLKKFLGGWVAKILPSLSVSNDVEPKWISRDPKVVHNYQKDPLVESKITLKLGTEILNNLEIINNLAKQIHTPVLFFHGSADRVTCPKGTQDFFASVAAKDRKLKIYSGFYHETLNDKGKEQVYQDIIQWLQERAI